MNKDAKLFIRPCVFFINIEFAVIGDPVNVLCEKFDNFIISKDVALKIFKIIKCFKVSYQTTKF